MADGRCRHAEVRLKAAKDLRASVELDVRDMNTDATNKFTSELTGRVFDLVNSENMHETLGGIALLGMR